MEKVWPVKVDVEHFCSACCSLWHFVPPAEFSTSHADSHVATTAAGYLLPVLFAVATALPVLTVAWILAFSVQHIGSFYGKMQNVQKWLNRIVGGVFTIIGIYYCVMMYL